MSSSGSRWRASRRGSAEDPRADVAALGGDLTERPQWRSTFVLSERAATILGDLKDWMATHNAAIMTVLSLVLGAKLLGDGIAGLS
jgi:hypothetical protein